MTIPPSYRLGFWSLMFMVENVFEKKNEKPRSVILGKKIVSDAPPCAPGESLQN